MVIVRRAVAASKNVGAVIGLPEPEAQAAQHAAVGIGHVGIAAAH
jgi:hypothetical protein